MNLRIAALKEAARMIDDDASNYTGTQNGTGDIIRMVGDSVADLAEEMYHQ